MPTIQGQRICHKPNYACEAWWLVVGGCIVHALWPHLLQSFPYFTASRAEFGGLHGLQELTFLDDDVSVEHARVGAHTQASAMRHHFPWSHAKMSML